MASTPTGCSCEGSDADAPHLGPWRALRRRVGDGGAVGIWHETYAVHPGEREAVYVNMPAFGLGKAIGSMPVDGRLATAKARLRAGRPEAARQGSAQTSAD